MRHDDTQYDGPRADIGVIGGSGLYALLDGEQVEVDTPSGRRATPDHRDVGGRRVAFLPRHGRDHRFPPHRVNYRANIWALRAVGVRQVLGPCAVGSLKAEHGPGTVSSPTRSSTGPGAGPHLLRRRRPGRPRRFADPYCPVGRQAALAQAAGAPPVVDGGTLVVVNGPRFCTRAESLWHQARAGRSSA